MDLSAAISKLETFETVLPVIQKTATSFATLAPNIPFAQHVSNVVNIVVAVEPALAAFAQEIVALVSSFGATTSPQ